MARGPRLTIPTRIFLSFVLVLLAFGLVSGASVMQHQRTAATLRLLHEGYLPLALSIRDAKATEAVFNTYLSRVLTERDPTGTREWLNTARRWRPAAAERAQGRIHNALALDPPDEDRAVLQRLSGQLDRVVTGYEVNDRRFDDFFRALDGGDADQAARVLGELQQRERQIALELTDAWRLVQGRIGDISQRSAEQEQQSVLVVALLALLALAAGLVVLWWSQRLLAPLPRLQKRVIAVARGDFAGKIEAARDDELGHLTNEFERMVEAISARDSRLRDLQRMQEQIVAGLRSAVLVIDSQGTLRSANGAAAALLSVTRDAIGTSVAQTELYATLPGLETAVAEVAGGSEPVSLPAAPLSGERFADVAVGPFGAGEGAVLVVVDDVTQELRTKARLIHTERLAAIGRMAAHVTHEVRNPLSAIGLNVELLEEELSGRSAQVHAILRSIQREIDRLTAVTEEYLRLARVPAPRLEPEDLGALVRDAALFVARELVDAKVELVVEVEEDLPLVGADEPQIRQALYNLLRNARESMPGGGEVRVSARAVRGGVEIAVADRGPGIAAEAKVHMFDLFYTTKERGTGLGLPLTQQIITAHGGTLECHDATDGGTVFSLWLPVLDSASAAAEE